MHVNKRASAARGIWRGSLLLGSVLMTLGVGTGSALAQAPGAAAPAGGAGAAPASGAGAAPAGKPAVAAPSAAAPSGGATVTPAAKPAAAAKPKRRLPMRACPAKVPAELNPPADVTLEMVLPASGVQSYACLIEKPGEAPDWAPKGPHAMLGEGNNLMGIHFGGPSWQALDGSLVKGTKISSASAPDKSAIVWLLLSGAPSGEGIFGNITHIQRLDTVGGKPPQGGCDASHLDTRVLVPYRSNYYFYREAAAGETVRQCKGAPSKAASGDKSGDKGTGKPNKAAAGDKGSDKPGKAATADKSGDKGKDAASGKDSSSSAKAAKPADKPRPATAP